MYEMLPNSEKILSCKIEKEETMNDMSGSDEKRLEENLVYNHMWEFLS